jgi:glycosyltransferase involved in cell wall biosynthesis
MLRENPEARFMVVGGSDVSYGARPQDGSTWRQHFIDEVRPQISDEQWSRVHFLGNLPYEQFVPLLQLSTVHVYLTYPFVLSWSLLEAMSVGCAIVASRTAPLLEAIEDNRTGRLVDFFDPQGLAQQVGVLLADPQGRARLGGQARAFAQERFDLRSVCLPRQLDWVQGLQG